MARRGYEIRGSRKSQKSKSELLTKCYLRTSENTPSTTLVNKAKNEGRSVKELQPWAIPKLYR
jgi:hypothetical protein